MMPDDYLYEAERVVHMRRLPARLEDPQEYIDYVTGTQWFRNRWRRRKIRAVESNHQHAWSDGNTIWLPRWSMNDFTTLHELAHCCVKHGPMHGRAFRAAQLELVRRFMGDEAGRCYKYALLAFDLDI